MVHAKSTAAIKRKMQQKCKGKITKDDRIMLSDNYRNVINTTGEMHLLVNQFSLKRR
jgi:hypothetical protein